MAETLQERIDKLRNGALKEIQKKHGQTAIMLGEGEFPKVDPVCSTGSIGLDGAIGIGGFPKGRIVEISGWESCGKSTLTLISIAECQRNGIVCAYIDGEQAFDPEYATKLGCDVNSLIISQPSTMEEAFDIMHSLIKSKLIGLVIYDSTNSLVTKRIFEGEVGDSNMGRSALLMSQELPKIQNEVSDCECTAIFISQIRSKIGVVYGSPDVIGIGNAMRFAASVRIKVSKSEIVKSDEEGQEAIDITASVFKNKVAPPYKKATFTLLTGKDGRYGIDTFKEIIDFAVSFEIIRKTGAWFKFDVKGVEERAQGNSNVVKFYTENPDEFKLLKEQVIAKLNESKEKDKPVVGSFDAVTQQPEKKERKVRKTEEAVAVELNPAE